MKALLDDSARLLGTVKLSHENSLLEVELTPNLSDTDYLNLLPLIRHEIRRHQEIFLLLVIKQFGPLNRSFYSAKANALFLRLASSYKLKTAIVDENSVSNKENSKTYATFNTRTEAIRWLLRSKDDKETILSFW